MPYEVEVVLLEGASATEIILWAVAFQALLLVLVGAIGLAGREQDQAEAYLLRWREEMAGLLDELGDTTRANAIRSWDGSTNVDSKLAGISNRFGYNLDH